MYFIVVGKDRYSSQGLETEVRDIPIKIKA